ncbi:hypothetical protein D3C80_1302770 [compost metagenome]
MAINIVDIAARVAGDEAGAEAKLVLDDGAADGDAALIADVPFLGGRKARTPVTAIVRQARRGGDETNRAALRAAAVQGALGSAQDLDPLKIEEQRHGRAAAGRAAALGQGAVVQIDARRRSAGGGIHAADGDALDCIVGARIAHAEARNCARQISHVRHALAIQGFLRHGRNAERRTINGGGLTRGGHHDVVDGRRILL